MQTDDTEVWYVGMWGESAGGGVANRIPTPEAWGEDAVRSTRGRGFALVDLTLEYMPEWRAHSVESAWHLQSADQSGCQAACRHAGSFAPMRRGTEHARTSRKRPRCECLRT